MALAGFSHGSADMFTYQHHGDYVSPDFYALLMEGSSGCEQPQSMDSLPNCNSIADVAANTTTLTDLLPTYSDLSSSSSGGGGFDYPLSATNSPSSESRQHQHSNLRFDNGDNLHYPASYSTSSSSSCSSSMLCFDHLENSSSVLDAGSLHPNNVMSYHNSLEASADHHFYNVAEEQPRWLYPRSNGILNYKSSEGHLATTHKRPYMGILMDDAQPNKRHCGGMVQKNPKPVVCKDPQSLAAKNRRERISERLKTLQELVPNGTKVDLVTMLDKAFHYVKFLQLQVKVLATDEFWPGNGVNAPEVGEVKDAIDAILESHREVNHSSATRQCFQTERSKP